MYTEKEPFGLYLHIPFCRSKCPYCDFCSFPRPAVETMEAYTHELIRRIEEAGRSPAVAGRSVDTVYFGGGTPTLLPADCVRALTAAVREAFCILPDAEITVECNPATADRAALAVWREGGVNRLSLGAQSAQTDELVALGRLHRWPDVERCVADARAVGIHNVNIDLMLGIPRQTPDTLSDTVSRVLALEPTHVSAYTLMLEEGTPFARRGRVALGLPADEDEADDRAVTMWEQTTSALTAAGYEHYEISNYARVGFRSRHNLHTWECRDYLGLGVAAHSCMAGVRFGQSRDLDAFLRGEDITEFSEILTEEDRLTEYVMLALRLSNGVDEATLAARFGESVARDLRERCEPFLQNGLMVREGGHLRLSERGFPVSNAVIAALI